VTDDAGEVKDDTGHERTPESPIFYQARDMRFRKLRAEGAITGG
jgi:hypothetical protein